jgi:YD repeat-containing protein
VANTAATTTYDAYDAMGRQLSVTKSITGASQAAYTTSYSYDAAGKLPTMTYPDGYQILHTYFAGSGLLNTVTGPSRILRYMPSWILTGLRAKSARFISATAHRPPTAAMPDQAG